MKPLAFFCLLLLWAGQAACEKELKEHKLPPGMKQEIAKMKKRQSPEAQAKEVRGTIVLAPARVLDQSADAVLFLSARPKGVTQGPPLAAKRYESFRLPLEFSLGPADAMVEGMPFEGPLTLTARLSAAGTALAQPGDIEGRAQVKPGDKGVKLVLDTVVPADPAQQVAGTITLSQALASKAPKGATLFIIARKAGAAAGAAPLAVRRIAAPAFPLAFTLGQADTMIPGMQFEGPVEITARLDQDGTAMPQAGDIEGRIAARAGDAGLMLVLNTVVEG